MIEVEPCPVTSFRASALERIELPLRVVLSRSDQRRQSALTGHWHVQIVLRSGLPAGREMTRLQQSMLGERQRLLSDDQVIEDALVD